MFEGQTSNQVTRVPLHGKIVNVGQMALAMSQLKMVKRDLGLRVREIWGLQGVGLRVQGLGITKKFKAWVLLFAIRVWGSRV